MPLAADVAGDDAPAKAAALGDGDVLLLENVRFEAAETSKDDAERGELADRLAALADVYVDDAFGAVHRKHASVFDVAERLPHYAGRLVARELEVLTRLTTDPERPYVVVLGGSKVSDKLAVIEALLPKVDRLLIGGGMCFTFLAAQGHGVGGSLLETDQVDTCRRLLAEAGDKIVLPVDVVCADGVQRRRRDQRRRRPTRSRTTCMGLDVGPRTVEVFGAELGDARTVFWNGPDGRLRARPLPGGHPRAWPRRSAPSTGCPSSAAGTPPPPSGSSASTRRPTATSAPAAARRWSTSRAGNCRASRCSPTEQGLSGHGTQGPRRRASARAGAR